MGLKKTENIIKVIEKIAEKSAKKNNTVIDNKILILASENPIQNTDISELSF